MFPQKETETNRFVSAFYIPPRNGSFVTAVIAGVVLAILTFILFLLPEFIFPYLTDINSLSFFSKSHWPLYAFATLLSLAAQPSLRTFFIILVTTLSGVWFGTQAFFGDVLGPAQVFQIKDQYFEVTETLFSFDSLVIIPITTIVVMCGIGVWYLQNRLFASRVFRFGVFGNVLLIAGYGVLIGRALFISNISIVYPSISMTSFIGPANAFSVAFRLSYMNASPPTPPHQLPQITGKSILPHTPITVVVIMGESINPLRMGLINQAFNTTPKLQELSSNAHKKNSILSTKVGFAAGVSTLGSVPGFLRIDYVPDRGHEKPFNIGAIAKQNGFSSAVVSSQRVKSLQLAGLPALLDFLHVNSSATAEQKAIHDDAIIEVLNTEPINGIRRFYFIHQRVNHSPYHSNCDHLPEFSNKTPTVRTESYDVGLKCYDRNTANLIKVFENHPGTVHIFMTADHNELMGEDHLWGHSTPNLVGALVPYMLYSNQPDSEIVSTFKNMKRPTSFEFTKLIATALGATVDASAYDPQKFYVNNSSPFAEGGYMAVNRLGSDRYKVEHRLNNNSVRKEEIVDLSRFNIPD